MKTGNKPKPTYKVLITSAPPPLNNTGITVLVRQAGGVTSYLEENDKLLTLSEGPYRSNTTRAALQSDRLLLIGGGIGISGLLSFFNHHQNIKLFYNVKSKDRALLELLDVPIGKLPEKHLAVGDRIPLDGLLREESNMGWSDIAVVVCGPVSMCDDVREIVARLAREKAHLCSFTLEVDSFSW